MTQPKDPKLQQLVNARRAARTAMNQAWRDLIQARRADSEYRTPRVLEMQGLQDQADELGTQRLGDITSEGLARQHGNAAEAADYRAKARAQDPKIEALEEQIRVLQGELDVSTDRVVAAETEHNAKAEAYRAADQAFSAYKLRHRRAFQ